MEMIRSTGNKSWCRLLLAVCLAAIMASGWLLPVRAAEPSVTFRGLEEGFKFAPGSEYTDTDLFQNFKDMMPGDSRTEVILFRNEAKDCDYANLYLRAVAHDPEGNPLSPALTEAGETEESANAFLAELTLEIRIGENLVYRGPANAGLETPVSLGTFRRGESAEIQVGLSMPKELGNEYAGRLGEIDWVFHGEGFTESQLTVRKVWSDGNEAHKQDKVTVNLLRDGGIADTAELSAENQWTYTFDGLAEGHVWTAEEAQVLEGYEVSYALEGNVTTITNTRKGGGTEPSGKTEVTVRKEWDSKKKEHPAQVTVTLYNGSNAVETVALNEKNGWTYSWTGLRDDGNWQVRETNVPRNYVPSYSVRDGVVVVTNTDALIQTGQLNWPIYVLGGLGLVLLIAGCAMTLRKKRHA